MFVFEDIVTMDNRSIQRFLRECDPKDIVLALKQANPEVANLIFSNVHHVWQSPLSPIWRLQ